MPNNPLDQRISSSDPSDLTEGASTSALADGEGNGRPSPDAGVKEKVLISPTMTFSFFVETYETTYHMGQIIVNPIKTMLTLSGNEAPGSAMLEHNPRLASDPYAPHVWQSYGMVLSDPETGQVLPGSGLIINEETVRLCKLTDDDPEDPKIAKPMTAWDKLLEQIRKTKTYGVRFCFVDDEDTLYGNSPEQMAKGGPMIRLFRDRAKELRTTGQMQHEYIQAKVEEEEADFEEAAQQSSGARVVLHDSQLGGMTK